ncbi:MAG TPA: XRE family transcriptional regulator [Tepidisphaeraceae bacterium]
MGACLRKARRRLGLTLDELAVRTSISKPYLSLIETGRVVNPPSDEKLRRLEQSLGFPAGQLVSQAHLHRTPSDIRAMLAKLAKSHETPAEAHATAAIEKARAGIPGIDLDTAYLHGVLHQLVDQTHSNVDAVNLSSVPVINRVSAGYPKDFTDLAYPRGAADAFIGGPNLNDPDAFAARVHGDSMSPKYKPEDIVIFSPAAPTRHGDDCFVRFDDGQTTFKRVYYENDAQGNAILRLQPRNEKYRPKLIAPEAVTGIYRAMYRYQPIEND